MNMLSLNQRSVCALLILWGMSLPIIGQEVEVYAEVLADEQHLYIKSTAEATFTQRRRVKILTPKGDSFGQFIVAYDNEFQKLSDISFTIFDEYGNEIKKMKKKDLGDVSLASGSVDDYRAKHCEYKSQKYPYIVEYEYSKEYKGLMFLPGWFPQSGENLSLTYAKLEVESNIPNIRYEVVGGVSEPEIISQGSSINYIWEMRNRQAYEREPYSPGSLNPGVLLAPSEFIIDRYQGEATTWESYGKFVYNLNKDRDRLPEELKQKVHKLTDHLESSAEKIATLYKFMQDNTRYVSIQLGIGGWQTFPAEYVYEHGFGDCKALTNYLQAMLKEVGITSYGAWINSNRQGKDIVYTFPSYQFNHIILCVPESTDTTWIECTNGDMPSGYIGRSNNDRHVLLITPEGGKLIKTPTRSPEQNEQSRIASIQIDKEGNAHIEAQLYSSGYQYDIPRYVHKNLSPRDQEKWLKRRIAAKNIELKGYEFQEGEGPEYTLNYQIVSRKFATPSGPRIFLPLNKLEQMESVPPKTKERKQPIRLTYPYLDTDTLTYELPQHLAVEAMPHMPMEFESEFGHYKANVEVQNDGRIVYTRYLRMKKVQLPAEAYEDFRTFYQQVVKADKVQMVLVDKS